MSIYTHFRHFLLINTHIIHIFSILNLNNLLNNLVLKYAYGLEKPKNVDKKWNIHGMTCIYSLLTHLSLWGWQVCYWHCLFHPWTSSQRARCKKHVFFQEQTLQQRVFQKWVCFCHWRMKRAIKWVCLPVSLSYLCVHGVEMGRWPPGNNNNCQRLSKSVGKAGVIFKLADY